jgi:hypothetical protein
MKQIEYHKSSIFNFQSSIPACPGRGFEFRILVIGIYLIFVICHLVLKKHQHSKS